MSEQFPSNELEVGLVAASEGGRTIRSWLVDLAQARVWVPVVRVPPEDSDRATFSLITLDDKQYLPVFTSRYQLESTLGLVPMMNTVTDDFVRNLPGNLGLAINPGGDLGLPLEPDSVQMLCNKPHTVEAGTSLFLGHPAVEPVHFLAQVADALRDLPGVRAVRRCWAVVGSDPPGLVLSVDLAQDTDPLRKQVLNAIAKTTDSGAPGFTVGVVFEADADEFTDWMLANTAPFLTTFRR